MRKVFLISSILLFVFQPVFAQIDTIANSFLQEFDKFKQDIQQEHQQFKTDNDSVFAKFLKDSWEEFDVFYKEKPAASKPVKQPVFNKKNIALPSEIKVTPADSAQNNPTQPEPKGEEKPAQLYESGGRAMINFDFYGLKNTFPNPGKLPEINRINAENISYYFENTCNLRVITDLVNELRQTKQRMHLNDWGYYKLVQKVAQSVEPKPYRQTLFTWVVMLKSGYNVKTGYTMDEAFLLLPADEQIFANRYLTINDVHYYIQSSQDGNKPFPKMMVHTNKYPDSRNISLKMIEVPLLGVFDSERKIVFKKDTFCVFINKTLIDFYNDYPVCDLKVYFSTPVSETNLGQLDKFFMPKFEGKSEKQKVEILLDFVQNIFAYQTDSAQFGKEKYLFPDEVFYYPYSDCEDRAILFSRLVKHYTSFDCVGLDFPTHVNTAVCFGESPQGAFIKVNNKYYTICDPTYVNAPIGYLHSKYESFQPKIISIN